MISPSRGGENNEEQIQSIGHSYTLPRPISSLNDIKKLMLKLAEKIGRRMRRKNARGNIIHYFHSDKQYESFHRQRKIGEFINDGRDIYRAAWGIFCSSRHGSNNIRIHPVRNHARAGAPEGPLGRAISNGVKIMGVSVSGLTFDKPQEPLFEKYKRPSRLLEVMDKINDKYGEFTLIRGRLIGINQEWGKDTVGFGRMKEFSM